MLLTQQGGILKPFATIVGYILEAIFFMLDKIGIPNTGLSIILFTIVIYLLMIPLTYKQQKFSKLNAKMNPELMAIRTKYNGKTDQESMMRMNAETQAVYAKYGVSPSGSCIQLLIQMPIMFALYRVIYSIPAYVGKVKEAFYPLVTNLINQKGSAEFIQTLSSAPAFNKQFKNELFNALTIDSGKTFTENTFIDVLNRASTADWNSISDTYPALSGQVDNSLQIIENYNNFFGINIGNSPSFTIGAMRSAGSIDIKILICVLLVPVLACVTQWINVKLMPQQPTSDDKNSQESAMMSSLKTMNTIMPIMSAVFCYTLPLCIGIYWITGSVVRSIIQVCINKKIDKTDIDEMIKKNIEKMNEKRAKQGLPPQQIVSNATINTKSIEKKNELTNEQKIKREAERAASIKESTDYYKNSNTAKPGSLAAKANMVKQYNEKNSKN